MRPALPSATPQCRSATTRLLVRNPVVALALLAAVERTMTACAAQQLRILAACAACCAARAERRLRLGLGPCHAAKHGMRQLSHHAACPALGIDVATEHHTARACTASCNGCQARLQVGPFQQGVVG